MASKQMLRRATVIAAATAVSIGLGCGIAQADDDSGSDGGHSSFRDDSSDGGHDSGEGSHSHKRRDSSRVRGGRGGEAGQNSADCQMSLAPNAAPKECSDVPAHDGDDGPGVFQIF